MALVITCRTIKNPPKRARSWVAFDSFNSRYQFGRRHFFGLPQGFQGSHNALLYDFGVLHALGVSEAVHGSFNGFWKHFRILSRASVQAARTQCVLAAFSGLALKRIFMHGL
jgi:hypothetical protein